jgi:iron complex outermembrane receptor protein
MKPSHGLCLPSRGIFLVLLAALSVALFPAVALAQAGRRATIRGIVSNQGTGQVLEGAKVETSGGFSVYSGSDGLYVLSDVPVGENILTVTYPGLDKVTETIEVSESGAIRDFKLTTDVYKLEGFVVTSQREGNAASIARQEKSLTLGNSIAMDAYGNVAKGDMGTFLQRLPGIVGEYGGSAVDAVLVRGLSQEFTTVTLDGTRAASANPDSRSQLVSSLPADSIESVEVIKTPTADMDGDSLGGVVNLRPRSGFDRTERAIVLNASAAYNDTFGKHLNPSGGDKYIFPQVSGQYSDVFLLGDRKLGVAITGTYQEVAEAPSTVRAQFDGPWDYVSPSVPRRVLYADQEFHVNKRAGLNTKFDLKVSNDSSLSFSASYNRFNNFMEQNRPQYIDSVRLDATQSTEDYWVFSRVRYRSNRDFRDMDYDTWRFKLAGKHKLGLFDLTWDASHEKSTRELNRISASARTPQDFTMVYDRRASQEFPTIRFTGGVTPDTNPFTNVSRVDVTATHEDSSNTLQSARIDLSRAFPAWRFPTVLKTGFRVRQEDRDRDADYATGTAPAGDYSAYRDFSFTHGWGAGRYPATPIFNTQKFFRDAGVSYQGNGTFAYNSLFPYNADVSTEDSLANDYMTKETIPAVYAQSEVTLAKNLKATLGIRYEQTKTELTSRYEDDTATTIAERFGKFKTTDGDYDTWFPNLQFRYEPIKHLILRAAYSTTIGRPRLVDLVSRFRVNEEEQELSFSNPSLGPQMSQNFDLSAEYYFEPVGVISVGVFRKELEDYVTNLSFVVEGNELGLDLSEYAGWSGTSKVNAGKGTVEGIEFNYSQQFNFLPGPLKHFGAMANWTVLSSQGDYNGLVTNLPFKNNLTGMRPRSGNAGLTFINGRVDLRLMWNYASDYLISLDTGDPSSSEFIGDRQQWDFFGRLNLTKNFNLFVDVINLTEENRDRYQGLPIAARQAQTNIFSRSITVGVQARF